MNYYCLSEQPKTPKKMNLNDKQKVELGYPNKTIFISGNGQNVQIRKINDKDIEIVCSDDIDNEQEGCCIIQIRATKTNNRDDCCVREAINLRMIKSCSVFLENHGKEVYEYGEEVIAIAKPGASFKIEGYFDNIYYYWDGKKWIVEYKETYNLRRLKEFSLINAGEFYKY